MSYENTETATTQGDAMSATKKKSWIVRMECTVLRDVYVSDCTEEEARTNPFEHATSEDDVDLRDWEVKSVEEQS
jgi:hypothetical protein